MTSIGAARGDRGSARNPRKIF